MSKRQGETACQKDRNKNVDNTEADIQIKREIDVEKHTKKQT